MADDTACALLAFEDGVIVSGGHLKRRLTIPKKDIVMHSSERFLRLSTVPSWASSLLAHRVQGQRVMARTNLIQTLVDARNECVKRLQNANGPELSLSIFDEPKMLESGRTCGGTTPPRSSA